MKTNDRLNSTPDCAHPTGRETPGRFTKVRFAGIALCVVSLAGTSPLVAGQLLLQDTFDTTVLGDVNFEYDAGRQTGILSPSLWKLDPTETNSTDQAMLVQVNTPDAPGQLWLHAVNGLGQYSVLSTVSPGPNFNQSGNFVIEFDYNMVGGTAGGAWSSFVLGGGALLTPPDQTDGFGFLVWHDGRGIALFDKTTAVGTVSPATAGFPGGWPFIGTSAHFRIEVSTSTGGFSGTAPGSGTTTLKLYINGQLVKGLGGAADGVYQRSVGLAGNNVTLMAGAFDAGTDWVDTYDNFSVSTVPKSIVALNDTYDTSAQGDVNFELALRQTGTLAPVAYKLDPTETNETDQVTLVQVNTPDAPGQLWLHAVNGLGQYAVLSTVSPDHNFNESGNFTIQFDYNMVGGSAGGGWSSFVIGGGALLTPPDQTDGFGFLVWHDGRGIALFDKTTAVGTVSAETAGFPGGWPFIGASAHFRIEVSTSTGGFSGTSPGSGTTTLKLYINGQIVKGLGGAADGVYQRSVGLAGNDITLMAGAFDAGTDWVDNYDNLIVSFAQLESTEITANPSTLLLAPGETQNVAITIPSAANASQPVSVTISNPAPGIVSLAGAVNNALTLNFAAGAANQQQIVVSAIASIGQGALNISGSGGLVGNNINYQVHNATTVLNPSFEVNYNPTSENHYNSITLWTQNNGHVGVNQFQDGPFADNGAIADGTRIGFVQGTNVLSQTITKLDPNQTYWLQFRYNVSQDTQGSPDPASVNLTVKYNGVVLQSMPNLTPVADPGDYSPAYRFINIPFTPTSSEGLLEFVTKNGDESVLLLEAVSIVPRGANDVLVINPSFESSGFPGGVGYYPNIEGWLFNLTGQVGINGNLVGPFADNGINPDQDSVLFLQDGGAAISQTISNLTAGQAYTLSFGYNARSGNTPHLQASVDGVNLVDTDVTPVGMGNYYHQASVSFTPAGPTAELMFTQTTSGDQTVLLDNVRITSAPAVAPALSIASTSGNSVAISWPTSATGYLLQSSSTVNGTYTDAGLPVVVQGDQNVATDTIGPGAKFYRLHHP